MKEGKEELPTPEEILGDLLLRNSALQRGPEGDLEGMEEISSLRNGATCDKYKKFLELFIPAVMTEKNFNRRCTLGPLSTYIDVSLEAFSVLVYTNGFDVWKKKFMQEDGQDASLSSLSSAPSGETQYRYTSASRGAGTFNGWSPQAGLLYDEMQQLAEWQRNTSRGRAMENELMEVWSAKKNQSGGLNANGGGASAGRTRVRNGLARLRGAGSAGTPAFEVGGELVTNTTHV